MKISFEALVCRFTIKELFIYAILKSLQQQINEGDLKNIYLDKDESKLNFEIYVGEEIDVTKCFKEMVTDPWEEQESKK
jgi:hypothetical protein